jgi:2-polyprenyl-6-methoxyphenol hydroxylase-like FAD-dependent oxidoreductase
MKKFSTNNWNICTECHGLGKKSQRLKKKVRLLYQQVLESYEKSGSLGTAPERPKATLTNCTVCSGSGLQPSNHQTIPNHKEYPHVAIIGAGIGGIALAVACLHRGIPFTLFERDQNFEARAQGYGLTLQQASVAMKGFGISQLEQGVISTRHVVHNPSGKQLGEWGVRKWMQNEQPKHARRTNMHIARQLLRASLLEQLGDSEHIHWGHQLLEIKQNTQNGLALDFLVNGQSKHFQADLVVGADGIRSTVRKHLIAESVTPLRYLGCLVILGICSLDLLPSVHSELLDGATVFQTANGHERIYIMPYTTDSVMWQLSFPLDENEAIAISQQGAEALQKEAIRRTPWHSPIPEILTATPVKHISGYPVYDRTLLTPSYFEHTGPITLLGDAAHPMSPFKGQGANQALLDALALARGIYKECRPGTNWRETGIRDVVLKDYEQEMLERSAVKVKDSHDAASFLHSDVVLYEGDEPRGRYLKRGESGKLKV